MLEDDGGRIIPDFMRADIEAAWRKAMVAPSIYATLGRGATFTPKSEPWPYGTVVRPTKSRTDSRRIMVLVHNDVQFSGVMLVSNTTWPVGYVSRGFSSQRWTPDTP
jgi:hypothetical protein